MAELLLTVPEAALRLKLSPLTVQRQLRRGVLRGIKRGKAWRVPESALMESSEVASPSAPPVVDTPKVRAQAIRGEMKSGDVKRRNAAIVALYQADAQTREIVFEATARAVAAWQGEEEDRSDWRALDGEPFSPDEEETGWAALLNRPCPNCDAAKSGALIWNRRADVKSKVPKAHPPILDPFWC